MGRKRVPGLDWLDPENKNQRLWALVYLRAKGFENLFRHREKILPNELPSHKEMLAAGMNIELEAEARELFGDMKDAWRQEKNRKKKKDNDRQVCAFSLNMTTKNRLQEMAKKKETNATALLETLITRAHKAYLREQQKQRPKQTLQGDRHRTILDLHDVLGGDVTQSDVTAMPSGGLAEESMYEPDCLEQDPSEYASEVQDEIAIGHLIVPTTLQTAESALEQNESNTAPLYPLHSSQTSALTGGEDQLEQAFSEDLSLRPTNDSLQTQNDDQLPPIKIRLPRKVTFTLPPDRLPMLQDTDHTDPNMGSDGYTTD